jgi:putative ABC transport system ATP-binding protein
MIQLVDVEKSYRMDTTELKVLKGINLKIKKGEMVSIIGPSGSGKSTMLHIMGCLDKPSHGKVIIDGIDVSRLSDAQLARIRCEKIGFVFQFFYLMPSMNAIQNVCLPMAFTRKPKNERESRAIQLLKIVGIPENRLTHMPNRLSGGERQRVAIARAMANDPEVILTDEPTGNLDSKSGKEIVDFLLKLNEEYGKTVVIITHDLYIASHAKRIIHIKDGKIIKDEKRKVRG